MIALQHVSKRYKTVHALNDISLEVKRGECIVIQGPSGSGKTTLLRLIAGLEIPDEGEIYIAGERVSAPGFVTPPHTRDIGFVFQRSALWPHMTVTQNLYFVMHKVTKEDKPKIVQQLLDQTHLEKLAQRYPHQLSGGEARRVAIARAIAVGPKILLLDEPLTSLDPELQESLLSLIFDYVRRAKATMLYVTHIAKEAESVGGKIIYLKDGQVMAE
jgi:iron(III) transport system ATP-binding protein